MRGLAPSLHRCGHDDGDDGDQRQARVAQPAGGGEEAPESGQQRLVDQSARDELRQHAPQGALDQPLAGQEERQRDEEAGVDAEVPQQRFLGDAGQE